ncbi:MAG: D-aminoacyl-tRNA deacylase [Thermonema sp.]|jgi:D-tyrosyl-tRNA(Tyr) deacylase|uniref:D-aminoacyl-tRNA deacylase n=1 Tax=Thermonema TaxID=28194 RepID=UPI00057164A6|nr:MULTISPECIES: D-aminoacyl-tRNA deacylase [Thermonema]GIV39282.1 MAG: D-aminoacyl-tRNA deacylase [Thermonema sp.]
MIAVIQRVLEASVTIDGNKHSEIGKGLLVLLGVGQSDTPDDVEWLAKKVVNMRIFEDEDGKMNRSLIEVQGELLVVSQFTLHASTKKGNRPSFIEAAPPQLAIPLYESFVEQCARLIGKEVKTGVFAADMKVALVNDGPVTIIVDTKNKR